uniref:Uncharacterized protein n=1 Tax=Datura stramonium TaxID=4076 RepID=A0ABS8SFK1_DATST|nr:hypothetical protein [Datura stramonium]
MVMADNRQRFTPLPDDRMLARYQRLAYAKDVFLNNPVELELRGEMYLSSHYAGDDQTPNFTQGEAWKKVFGPVFIYVNPVMQREDLVAL